MAFSVFECTSEERTFIWMRCKHSTSMSGRTMFASCVSTISFPAASRSWRALETLTGAICQRNIRPQGHWLLDRLLVPLCNERAIQKSIKNGGRKTDVDQKLCLSGATRLVKSQQGAGKEYCCVLRLHDKLPAGEPQLVRALETLMAPFFSAAPLISAVKPSPWCPAGGFLSSVSSLRGSLPLL